MLNQSYVNLNRLIDVTHNRLHNKLAKSPNQYS
jgi:hypothetical protein